MSDRVEREAVKSFGQQSELARTLGMESRGGAPQLRRRERSQLLGQFRERVVWGITKQALDQKTVHGSFMKAIDAVRCERLLVRSDVLSLAMGYVRQATARSIPYTFVQSPEFTGDVALVLVSDQTTDSTQDPIIG